ncbi:serine hydrolase domain-containing protein [Micromonospora sp. 4G57]|uniref:Serine hydrolase domain-containing protein n=1 Tax=Micromonospora sicca TaxID=2202420 RepID=A0ABU5J661_9ACTN|nr:MULTISPECIES: serine hydrolase domain-containing protein [unclassified Micromonospora]MDZ5443507.1 serine hydrolase domain-containing protein [Micromonospora sp. 4G57]MDZ5487993.1 serine hydrolase domain-containing protein [Micromonospora sp. 4G53]
MSRLKATLVRGLEGGHRPLYSAAVALIQRDGHPTDLVTVGHLSRYADADGALVAAESRQPALASTIFDLASMTKLFTTAVLLTLVDEGRTSLDEPIAGWLPTFGDGERRRITLRHLLTHTSGLPALLQLWTDWPDQASRVRAVLRTPLVNRPGESFEYSCVGFLVAGLLAERITGRRLPDLVQERVCRPLGLTDTGFLPGPARAARAAATEHQPHLGRGMLRGSVHDENSWSLGGTAGNAGLFGTAADVARFGQMLRQGGAVDGVRVLRPDTVAEMTRDHLPPAVDPGFRHGLGVRIGDPHWMGTRAAAGAFGHTGFTGTALLVDPGRDLVAVLLTNRVHPRREWSDIAEIRRAVAELAVGT